MSTFHPKKSLFCKKKQTSRKKVQNKTQQKSFSQIIKTIYYLLDAHV